MGHIYRLEGWQGNPPPINVGSSPTMKVSLLVESGEGEGTNIYVPHAVVLRVHVRVQDNLLSNHTGPHFYPRLDLLMKYLIVL